jgi:hypothetical protein
LDIGLLLIIVFILAPLLEKLLASGRKRQQPPELPPGQRLPGQRQPGQGTGRTQQRWPAPDEEETPFRSVPAGHGDDDESAAGVVPDDLWEILTGERRPPPQPQREEPAEAAPSGMGTESAERPPIDRPAPPIDRPVPQPAARDRSPRPARDAQPTRERTRPKVDMRDRTRPPVELRDRSPRERDPEKLRPTGRPVSAADAYVRPEHVRAERVITSHDDRILGDEERHTRFHERLDSSAALAAATAAARAAALAGPQVYRFTDAADLRRAIVMAEILGPPKGLEQG